MKIDFEEIYTRVMLTLAMLIGLVTCAIILKMAWFLLTFEPI